MWWLVGEARHRVAGHKLFQLAERRVRVWCARPNMTQHCAHEEGARQARARERTKCAVDTRQGASQSAEASTCRIGRMRRQPTGMEGAQCEAVTYNTCDG